MYEQIYNDKLLFFTKAKNAPRLGCTWTADLRTTYHVASTVDEDAVNPKDENVQASAMLQEVCDASRSQQADRSRLISWLQRQNSLPHQTEICRLFLHCTELKPWLGGTGHDFCLEMLEDVVRLDLHNHFPAECAAVKHQFDKTMVQSWSVMTGKGYTPGGCWSGNAQWCGPLLNVEFVSRLLRVQANDWTGHEGEVATVVGSCMLGARLPPSSPPPPARPARPPGISRPPHSTTESGTGDCSEPARGRVPVEAAVAGATRPRRHVHCCCLR